MKNQSPPIVIQSNKLTEARYTLTITEQRLVLFLLSKIRPEDEDFKDYEIKVSDFKDLLGIQSKAVYGQMKDILKRLASRTVYIERNGGFLISHWFSSAEYIPHDGVVRISLDQKLKPYLIQLKEQFTKYRLFVIAQFQSTYTVRMYMLLKQYQAIGYREFDLQELREILGIADDTYPDFKRFRARVINQAQKELGKKNKEGHYLSDINFELVPIRTGRKITRLRFNIKTQKHQEHLPIELDIELPSANTELERTLQTYGFSSDTIANYLKQQTPTEILRCIELLEEAKKSRVIKSESAYLRKLLDDNAGKRKETVTVQPVPYSTTKSPQEENERLEGIFFRQIRDEFISTLSDHEQQALLEKLKASDSEQGELMKDLYSPFASRAIKQYIPDYELKKTVFMKESMK